MGNQDWKDKPILPVINNQVHPLYGKIMQSSKAKAVLHDQMKVAVKERAVNLLRLDEKVATLGEAIDNGDTNLFFLEMFGKEVMLSSKLITSLQTSFGMSFYEQISHKLATLVGYTAKTQYKLTGFIHADAKNYLDELLEDLSYSPDRKSEYKKLSEIYGAIKKEEIGELAAIPDSTVDVFIKKPDGTEIYIDITTVKPNKKEFRTMKAKILKWYFLRLSHGDITPDKIQTFIAIPYNPESSTGNSYTRWGAYYDRKDLLVGDELWKLVSNGNFSLDDMIDVFKDIGTESKAKIRTALNGSV